MAVIAWGAYVRATGSGAGCGRHWPLCNGDVFPRSLSATTLIELSHRITSGLSLLLVLGLWGATRLQRFACSASAKRWATIALVFIVIEALIGAGLVLFELVQNDKSVFRASMIAVHLANSLGLIGALALCWWSIVYPAGSVGFTRKGMLMLASMALVGMTGAITALGDTLFPSAGHLDSFSSASHFLVQLRIVHPALAILLSVWIGLRAYDAPSSSPLAVRSQRYVLRLLVIQLLMGCLNIYLKAPVALQLLHLFVADLLWISLVLLEQVYFVHSKNSDESI
jgi:heme a synthase